MVYQQCILWPLTKYTAEMYCRHARLRVCLFAAACPHYSMDLDVTWGSAKGCTLVVHRWVDLQSVHGLHCYGNITRTRNVSKYMLVLALCLVISVDALGRMYGCCLLLSVLKDDNSEEDNSEDDNSLDFHINRCQPSFQNYWPTSLFVLYYIKWFTTADGQTVPSVLWRCWLGSRKVHRPVKNSVVRYWRGYLSGARYKWFAYGPADVTATSSSKIQNGLPFWCQLMQAVLKKAVKWT